MFFSVQQLEPEWWVPPIDLSEQQCLIDLGIYERSRATRCCRYPPLDLQGVPWVPCRGCFDCEHRIVSSEEAKRNSCVQPIFMFQSWTKCNGCDHCSRSVIAVKGRGLREVLPTTTPTPQQVRQELAEMVRRENELQAAVDSIASVLRARERKTNSLGFVAPDECDCKVQIKEQEPQIVSDPPSVSINEGIRPCDLYVFLMFQLLRNLFGFFFGQPVRKPRCKSALWRKKKSIRRRAIRRTRFRRVQILKERLNIALVPLVYTALDPTSAIRSKSSISRLRKLTHMLFIERLAREHGISLNENTSAPTFPKDSSDDSPFEHRALCPAAQRDRGECANKALLHAGMALDIAPVRSLSPGSSLQNIVQCIVDSIPSSSRSPFTVSALFEGRFFKVPLPSVLSSGLPIHSMRDVPPIHLLFVLNVNVNLTGHVFYSSMFQRLRFGIEVSEDLPLPLLQMSLYNDDDEEEEEEEEGEGGEVKHPNKKAKKDDVEINEEVEEEEEEEGGRKKKRRRRKRKKRRVQKLSVELRKRRKKKMTVKLTMHSGLSSSLKFKRSSTPFSYQKMASISLLQMLSPFTLLVLTKIAMNVVAFCRILPVSRPRTGLPSEAFLLSTQTPSTLALGGESLFLLLHDFVCPLYLQQLTTTQMLVILFFQTRRGFSKRYSLLSSITLTR